MSELTPQQISVSFVAQYYFILSSNTKNLFKFYKNESEMTHEHSIVVKQLPGNINPNTAIGADIEKKISTLGYEECKVKLTYVDSQRSLDGSVFVFVEGVMTRQGDQKEMNFTQTFLLAEQEYGYYVRNDYLRFIQPTLNTTPSTSHSAPVTHPSNVSSTPVATSENTSSNTTGSTTSATLGTQHENHKQNGSTPHQLSFSLTSPTVNIVSTNGSHSPRSETSSTAATAGASSVYGGAEDNQLDDETEEEEIKPIVEKKSSSTPSETSKSTKPATTQAESKEPHGTISYAAAVGGKDYKNEEQPQQPTKHHKSAKKHNKEHKSEKTEKHEHKDHKEHKSEHKEHKTEHHKNEHKEHKSEHKNAHKNEHKTEHKDHKEHKSEHKTEHKSEHKSEHKGEHKKPNSAPSGEPKTEKKEKSFRGKDHPLNKHAVYVRDLPVGTKDSDLTEAFSSFGTIIDVNNKSGKDQSYNKYALIFFEKQQSVDELLKKPTVIIGGIECPITKYQRKPKQPFTPRTQTSTDPKNTTPQQNQSQPATQQRTRVPRQKFTRTQTTEGESEKK